MQTPAVSVRHEKQVRAMQTARIRTRRQGGVTLIELMTVMAVLAIISSIAVATYRNYILRANRTDGTGTLLRVQVAQESFFLQNNRYATGAELTTAPPAGLGLALGAGGLTGGGHYTITVASPSGTQYTATATAAGGQTADKAACLVLSIDQTGTRTPDAASGCWR
jgi:type IV pilus assembly protein PilE